MMITPKIALVVDKKEDIDIYLRHLHAYDTEITVCPSFIELESSLSMESFNGIIVDLKTKLSLPRDQKMLAYDLLEHYPVLQSRLIPDSGRLQTMPFGKVQRDVSLATFLTEECPNFEARRIRSTARRSIHFNVLLSKTGSFSGDDVERTATLNISHEGCFIISAQKWLERSSVPFIIKELDVQTPIVGEICWNIPWGKFMKVPGIGIKFEDIHAEQHKEMMEKYHLK